MMFPHRQDQSSRASRRPLDLSDSLTTLRSAGRLWTFHHIEPSGDRNRVVYAMQIAAPEADTLGPRIGTEISADLPQVLASPVERAEADDPRERRPESLS